MGRSETVHISIGSIGTHTRPTSPSELVERPLAGSAGDRFVPKRPSTDPTDPRTPTLHRSFEVTPSGTPAGTSVAGRAAGNRRRTRGRSLEPPVTSTVASGSRTRPDGSSGVDPGEPTRTHSFGLLYRTYIIVFKYYWRTICILIFNPSIDFGPPRYPDGTRPELVGDARLER